jgi:hypothetical protein
VEVIIDAQGQIDHLHGFGNDFGPAAEAREKMADVGYVPSHFGYGGGGIGLILLIVLVVLLFR